MGLRQPGDALQAKMMALCKAFQGIRMPFLFIQGIDVFLGLGG